MAHLRVNILHNLRKGGYVGKIHSQSTKFLTVTFSTKVPEIPVNILKDTYKAHLQPGTGKVYDKKPFKMPLEAGKRYSWCTCGFSHTQPFCDGTHKNQQLRITLKPVAFAVSESKEYWLCNCKQTKNRPFCDGTHKAPEIQEGPTVAR